MKYHIVMEGKTSQLVTVDAASYDAAIKLAQQQLPEASVKLRPTWVGDEFDGEELKIEYLGDCQKCQVAITTEEKPGTPWNYYHDETGLICYPCHLRENWPHDE